MAQGLGAVFADGYAYFQDRLVASGTPAPLVRGPLGGGATQVLYAGEGHPFAVHGGYVYFLNVDSAVHRVAITGGTSNLSLPKLPRYFVLGGELERTRLGGDGERQWIAPTRSPQSFDKTSIYVTDQIGGEEAPRQGVIVQIPK